MLKNSVFERRRSNLRNILPQNSDIANEVCYSAPRENKVPSFRCEFRVEEFFNTISPDLPRKAKHGGPILGGHSIAVVTLHIDIQKLYKQSVFKPDLNTFKRPPVANTRNPVLFRSESDDLGPAQRCAQCRVNEG